MAIASNAERLCAAARRSLKDELWTSFLMRDPNRICLCPANLRAQKDALRGLHLLRIQTEDRKIGQSPREGRRDPNEVRQTGLEDDLYQVGYRDGFDPPIPDRMAAVRLIH